MTFLAVRYARWSNHAAALAAGFARIGHAEHAREWRERARYLRGQSRYFATVDHPERKAA